MDSYLDTMPNKRGAEIKKRVSERDGTDEDGPLSKRIRAKTYIFLTGKSDEGIEEPLNAEENSTNYSRERPECGLRYVTSATKRKVTPRTQKFLKPYKDTYKAALEGSTTSEASRAVVEGMNHVYYFAFFYLAPRSNEEHNQLMFYIELRRLESLANYGNQLGLQLQEAYADIDKATIATSNEARHAALEFGQPSTSAHIVGELAGADINILNKQVYIACGV